MTTTEDGGDYWGGDGAHQELYDALSEYIPPTGHPLYEMFEPKIAKALVVVYLISRIQHEHYNNGFMNVEPEDADRILRMKGITFCDDTEDITKEFLEREVGYNYLRMVDHLYETYNIGAASDIIQSFQLFNEEMASGFIVDSIRIHSRICGRVEARAQRKLRRLPRGCH
jgi:hypothetical protein